MSLELLNINVADIEVSDRARENYGGNIEWESFRNSIAERGVLEPIIVKRQDNGKFKLLAGGRRTRACQELGLAQVPCVVYPQSLSDLDSKAIELIENVQRRQLDWVEEVKLKREVHELQVARFGEKVQGQKTGWSQSDTGTLFGNDRTTISKDLKLAELLSKVPALGGIKNKADAVKFIEKAEKAVANEQTASAIMKQQAETPVSQLHKIITDSYIVGDFFAGVKSVPDSSIDLVELDWPYAIDLSSIKKIQTESGTDKRDSYNEISESDYPLFVDNVLRECFRVMSPNSWIIIWFSPRKWYDSIWNAVLRAGFTGRDLPALWVKTKVGQTHNVRHHLASDAEYFFYARKGDPEIVKQGRSNLFTFKAVAPQNKIHPTERPIEMIQEVLSTFQRPGARVMVPFLGSGNTILAAANLGMPAFGWDLGEKADPLSYKNGFIIRVHAAIPPEYRSYRGGDE